MKQALVCSNNSLKQLVYFARVMMSGSILFLYLFLLGYSSQVSTPDDNSYVAAVVEYQVQDNLSTNLQNYLQFIRDAADQNADIIVFPEMTLSEHVNIVVPINSLLKEYPIPALQPTLYDEILVSISEAARQNQIYVVINVEERLNCTSGSVPGESCPERKMYLFNVNVVFDRTGAVIDRYRKIHLFAEFTRTPALSHDLGIFKTDFGVTFGHFICFDLLFQVPSVQIVEKYNITDIIFSTMWFSEMPYLSAIQIQQAYAYAMNVNFLGAGANDVAMGTAGSGIYSGKAGALLSIIPGVPTSKLLVARVPKQPGQVKGNVQGPIYADPSEQDDLFHSSDMSLSLHTTKILKPGFNEFTLESGDTVCQFRVKMLERNGQNIYQYRAGVFNGIRSFIWIRTAGLKICAIFSCTTGSVASCGRRFRPYSQNSTAVFETLEIAATVPTPEKDVDLLANKSVYFPVTLNTSIMPLQPNEYSFNMTQFSNATNVYKFSLQNYNAELYTFAIWGREYSTD